MKLAVCIKEVADTATKIELKADALGIADNGVKYTMNPYDEFALEEALLLKDRQPETEVVAVTLGPERAGETVRKALAMGADRAVHIKAENLPFGDGLVVATILAKALANEAVDGVLLGKQAVDDDSMQVGPMLASLLSASQAMNVVEIDWTASGVTAKREVEGGAHEILALQKPFVVGMTKGVHEPRYASLKGIMAAKKKETKAVAMSELGVDVTALSSFKIDKFSLPAERGAVVMIKGDPTAAAEELVRRLREEAKVI